MTDHPLPCGGILAEAQRDGETIDELEAQVAHLERCLKASQSALTKAMGELTECREDLTRVNALYTAELDRAQAVLDALGARAGERVDHAAQRVAGELREARERLRLACTNPDVASIVERARGKAGTP